ncbi:MAG TPA: amino acid adenylation domain-containing protein [Streptosporangiaceae bacterium]|nr:amino acid adenylation domain-containing protein [Streptosporangiaceae bacterium]
MGTKVRLSRIQEQLWLAERLGLHPTGYLARMILEIKGPVDEDALRSSFLDIVTRHEILRTRFFEKDGKLQGEITPIADLRYEAEFYSEANLPDRGGLAAVLAAEEATLIDVSQEIPIKVKLIRTADGNHLLSLVLHHLVFDDWSRNQLYSELAERYRVHATGSGAAPRPLAPQYHQYSAGMDERNESAREASLTYWRHALEDLEPFEIEPDYPRPSRRRGRGATTGFEIEAELAASIRRVGIVRGASTAMVLFAAVQVALSRFTGRDDVSFGTMIAARDDEESQELIGPLINTVVLRGDLSGDPSFADLVDRMADTLLDAMEHSRTPFSQLVAEYGAAADLSRNPLAQIIVQYASGVRRRPELEGCEVTELSVPATGSKYDLVILFDEFDDGRLAASIGWDRDLYAADTIQGLADSLRSVIDDIALAPRTRRSAVRMLTGRAESEILAHQRGPSRDQAGLSLCELVEVQARTRPDSVAVVPDGEPSCTYAELDSMADRVATLLSQSGVGTESIVAVHAPQLVTQVASILGVLKAGAAYLALDPGYPAELIRYMLKDSGASAILFEGELSPELRQRVRVALRIANIREGNGELQGRQHGRAHQDGACALIYTSGSTGRPKGVVLTHKGLAGRLADLQGDFPLRPSDRVLVQAPSALGMSIAEQFWPLAAGAAAVLARPGGHRDPSYIIGRIERAAVTVASFVPTVLETMAGHSELSACGSLRMITATGEVLHRRLVRQFRERLPDCEIRNGYGPTEASVYSSWRRCGPDGVAGPVTEPLGSPLPNTRMYVLDQWQNPVPPGGVGELYIGGPGLARGYLGRPGLTAQRFVPDPYADGERLYRTGDVVRYSDATRSYRVLGRLDLQVKIGGVRVDFRAVESVLASHPSVAQCAVVVKRSGDGEWGMSAFVVLAAQVDSGELLDHARRWLPPVFVPSAVTIVDAIPTLPDGKADRQSLLDLGEAALPLTAQAEVLTEHQRGLLEIWREVLDPADVTTASNFFMSGGQSLLAIQMTNRTREHLDLDVPLSLVFEAPVFKDFSNRLAEMVSARATGERIEQLA